MSEYKTDIDIAREVSGEHINDIGAKLNIDKEDLVPFGHDKAKISWVISLKASLEIRCSKLLRMLALQFDLYVGGMVNVTNVG